MYGVSLNFVLRMELLVPRHSFCRVFTWNLHSHRICHIHTVRDEVDKADRGSDQLSVPSDSSFDRRRRDVQVRSEQYPTRIHSTSNTTLILQSDIARLRSLVIHSLYSHKDVFLRELVSNANDALEKLRITALTDRNVMNAGEANVTMEVNLYEGGATGQLIIRGASITTDVRP